MDQSLRISVPASTASPCRDGVEVLVADHDPLARKAVHDVMSERDDVLVVGEAGDAVELIEAAQQLRPAIALVGADLPPAGAIIPTIHLGQALPSTRVILFAVAYDLEYALRALEAGASGYLSKDIDMSALARALYGAAHGQAAISRRLSQEMVGRVRMLAAQVSGMRPVDGPLTNRQWQVLDLLAQGYTSTEIADLLALSLDTVRGHTRQLLRGLGADTTAEAVEVARRLRTGG